MIKKKLSIIIFFLSVVLFCVNLRINFSEDSKTIIFWVSIILMLGMILYQIFYVKNNRFVLFEIILFYFLLHLLFQINYFGLTDVDTYRDYNFLKTIINNNYIVITPYNLDVSGWPLLHLFTSFITIIIKIDPLVIAKFLPSFIESIIAISIYLFVYALYKNEKAALLSCLIAGTIPKFVSYESLFVRESFAIYFFILFIFILYIAKQRDDPRFLALSFLLIPVIVLSHHFTSLVLIIMLLIFIIFSKTMPILFRKNSNLTFTKININTVFIILLLTTIFYWCFFSPGLLNDFFKVYLESTGVKEFVSYGQRIGLGQTIITLRGNVLFYGFFFFQGILSLILLIAIFLKKQKQVIENVSFTFFLFFCLGLGAVSLFLLGSLIYPDRLLPIGWLIGAIPLSILVFSLKNIKIRRIIVLIIISFLIFNIYNIDPYYYTGKGPFDGRSSEREYAIAETITIPNPNNTAYYGYVGVADALYDITYYSLPQVDMAHGGIRNPIAFDDSYTHRLYTFTTKQANNPPVFGTPSPANDSKDDSLNLTWSIPINDPEGNLFSWTIQCSNGQENNGSRASNGIKSLSLTGLAYSTTFKVWVNSTDLTDNNLHTYRWYTFTTKLANYPPVFSKVSPVNSSTGVTLHFSWSISINDSEGDPFSWTIQCNNGQVISETGASNGTKTLIFSGFPFIPTYKVRVNATDPAGSGLYTYRWYTFTTRQVKRQVNFPPVFGTPSPLNDSTANLLSLSWNIPIKDPEGDSFSWTIQCSNGQTNNGNGATNGTKSLSLSGLAYSTTYKVWVNATDPTGSRLHKYSNLAIIYKDLYLDFLVTEKIKSETTYQRINTVLSFEDSNDINKICDLGDVFISTWKK
jgi:hypothetical protein